MNVYDFSHCSSYVNWIAENLVASGGLASETFNGSVYNLNFAASTWGYGLWYGESSMRDYITLGEKPYLHENHKIRFVDHTLGYSGTGSSWVRLGGCAGFAIANPSASYPIFAVARQFCIYPSNYLRLTIFTTTVKTGLDGIYDAIRENNKTDLANASIAAMTTNFQLELAVMLNRNRDKATITLGVCTWSSSTSTTPANRTSISYTFSSLPSALATPVRVYPIFCYAGATSSANNFAPTIAKKVFVI